jgi:hypothetical protein
LEEIRTSKITFITSILEASNNIGKRRATKSGHSKIEYGNWMFKKKH